MEFSDRLVEAVERKQSRLVVGLDPHINLLPPPLLADVGRSNRREVAEAVFKFSVGIIDAVSDYAAAIKPQVAFFERLGGVGYEILESIFREARDRDLIAISDAKRGDIGSTAQAYADFHLGACDANSLPGLNADAMTLNPYMGADSLDPFVNYVDAGKGLFLLAKTSNHGSSDFQDRLLESSGPSVPLYEAVGELVNRIADHHRIGDSGYASIGLVVGATFPEQARILRTKFPRLLFLVPGVGAQGARPEELRGCFDAKGHGVLINASRSVIFAYQDAKSPDQWKSCARSAAQALRDQLNSAISPSRRGV